MGWLFRSQSAVCWDVSPFRSNMAFHREFTPGTMSPQSAPGLAEPRPLASYLNELGVICRADGERRGNDLLGQSTIRRFICPIPWAGSLASVGERLATLRYFSARGLGQMCERSLQPSCKFLIQASNLAQQSANHNPESPREFGGVQLPDEGTFELRDHSAWQQIHTTAMDSRKAVANAGQRKRVVADTANHVFRLP